jgi:hypothetical protein
MVKFCKYDRGLHCCVDLLSRTSSSGWTGAFWASWTGALWTPSYTGWARASWLFRPSGCWRLVSKFGSPIQGGWTATCWWVESSSSFDFVLCANETNFFWISVFLSWLICLLNIQWNLYLSFPDNSFSWIRRSISMVPEWILFQLWFPHLLFSWIHCFFFRPPTKTMNRGFTVYPSSSLTW